MKPDLHTHTTASDGLLTPAELVALADKHRVTLLAVTDHDTFDGAAQLLGKPVGLLKAIVDADTDRLLGAHLFCEESHEMINTAKLAIDVGLSYQVLRDAIYTHPTMSEAFNDLLATVK